MNPDMLLLAERLVMAMETMSEDLKNMSAYVYDISCSVSYLLNEKREKESNSIVACNEGDNPLSISSAAGQETSAEREYSGQYDQRDEISPLNSGDIEQREGQLGVPVSMRIDPHDNSNILPSGSNLILTGSIKIEDPTEFEVNHESCDVRNAYGNTTNNVGIITREIESETQSETDAEDQVYGLIPTISHPVEQLTDQTAFPSRLLDGEPSVSTYQMESAKVNLMAHKSVDSGERSLKCSVCEKSFKTLSLLVKHTKVHSGERPYKCKVCGKAFTLSSNLTRHIRCHTREKPYQCAVCGKAYSRNRDLRDHIGIHTGDKSYKCTLCRKAFRYAPSLSRHMNTHSAEHPN